MCHSILVISLCVMRISRERRWRSQLGEQSRIEKNIWVCIVTERFWVFRDAIGKKRSQYNLELSHLVYWMMIISFWFFILCCCVAVIILLSKLRRLVWLHYWPWDSIQSPASSLFPEEVKFMSHGSKPQLSNHMVTLSGLASHNIELL